jgi:hypothetical protein
MPEPGDNQREYEAPAGRESHAANLSFELRRPPNSLDEATFERISAAWSEADPTALHHAIVQAIRETRNQGLWIDDSAEESLRQILVANGLADAFGAAKALTDPGSTVRSREERQILALATGQNYSAEFRPGAPADPNLANNARIHPDDWIALAAAETDPADRRDFLRRAAAELHHDAMRSNMPDVHDLIETADAYDPSLVADLMSFLRPYRAIHRQGNPSALARGLDNAVVRFIIGDREDLARGLITPSPNEGSRLGAASASLEEEDRPRAVAVGRQIQSEKQAELEAGLQRLTGSPAKATDLGGRILNSEDPESALSIGSDFWEEARAQPFGQVSTWLTSAFGHLPESADALVQMSRHGLLDEAHSVLRPAVAIQDPAARRTYLESLAAAQQAIPDSDEPREWYGLHLFQDPRSALEIAQRLFPRNEDDDRYRPATALYIAFGGHSSSAETPAILDPRQIKFLETANGLIPEAARQNFQLTKLGQAVANSDDPGLMRAGFLEAVKILEDTPDPAESAAMVIASSKPLEMARAWSQAGEQIHNLPDRARESFLRYLRNSEHPAAFTANLFTTLDILGRNGVPLDEENANEILDFVSRFELLEGELDVDHLAAEFAELRKIRNELLVHAERHVNDDIAQSTERPEADDEDELPYEELEEVPNKAPHHYIDPLEGLPELKQALNRLGIPDNVARKMHSSWMSFRGSDLIKALTPTEPRNFTEDEKHMAQALEVNAVVAQIEAIQRFVKAYGIARLQRVHETFRTVDFARYDEDQLDAQLTRWDNLEEPVVNITALGLDDPGTALEWAGSHARSRFGEAGQFVFEFSSKKELWEISQRVGERERAAGRDPLKDPNVENFLIETHGNQKAIFTGLHTNKDGFVGMDEDGYLTPDIISLADYNAAARLDVAPNTYQKHLGNRFRVILFSCLTGGKVKPLRLAGKEGLVERSNIAQRIHGWHDAPTVAPPAAVWGAEIKKDGTVRFLGKFEKSDSGPGNTYGDWPRDEQEREQP